jgi:hypothetical protein
MDNLPETLIKLGTQDTGRTQTTTTNTTTQHRYLNRKATLTPPKKPVVNSEE